MQLTPGWVPWSTSLTLSLAFEIPMTLLPNKSIWSLTESLSLQRTNGWNSFPSKCIGHPWSTSVRTLAKRGLRSVPLHMSETLSDETCKRSNKSTVSPVGWVSEASSQVAIDWGCPCWRELCRVNGRYCSYRRSVVKTISECELKP